MKETRKNTPLYFAMGFIVLIAAIITLIFMFMARNRVRIADQNKQYLEDASLQTVRRVDELFSNSSMSIRMVSRLYELQLDKPEFDYRMLNEMSEPTPFDHIRFISPEGISYSGEGKTVDVSDREYYLEGINGRSGMCFYNKSRFTDEPIFAFYTPLYYEEQIIGVVCGIISAEEFAENFDSTIFGVCSYPCICTRQGEIISAAFHKDMDVLHETPFSSSFLTAEEMEGVRAAMADGGIATFSYKGKSGDGIAVISPLAEGEFMLVQTFPSAASKKITDRANQDALRLEIAMVAVFAIYLAFVVMHAMNKNRRLASEKKDLSQIVDSVKRLYRRFVIFDLEYDTYEYLEEGDINSLGLPPEGSYTEWFGEFRKRHLDNPKCWGPMDDMTVEHLQETITDENWYAHREYRTPDGRWERLSLIKLDMDVSPTCRILGAVEDITDTKKRSEESRKAMETAFHAAEAASHAKSEFLSRMSHDIRTPMNAIVGLTAIMGAHLDDRDRIVDCLTKITSSSKHLLGLINEVLDMSKIESGKLAISEGEFSLPSLIDDLLSIIQPNVNAKHQHLSVNINGIVHENVIGDNVRLQQVFVNILSNSVKYTGEDGHLKMTISELPSNQPLIGKYEFVFEDDGIGMPPEFLEKVFSPFERAEDERVSTIQGTGLGMSIAQSIIRLMGGNISVESEVDKGSKFTVSLSLRLQDTDEKAAEQLIGLPVLVADDEQVSCVTACMMLDDLGMTSEWVLTGKDAVEKVTAHHKEGKDFFAVILDWKMPGMDGVETAKAIRREVGPEVPIIILSAYDWSDIESEARAAGVNMFIGKPLFKSRLRGVFMEIISDASGKPEDPLNKVKAKEYPGKRALLVEDNELNQEIAKEILEMMSIEVEVAENGRVALEKFTKSPKNYYDIVFMDIQMPIMNGLEASRAIRALSREDASTTPIVAMTANTFSEDVRSSLEAGMVQHIGKPLDMDQLASVLDRWLVPAEAKK